MTGFESKIKLVEKEFEKKWLNGKDTAEEIRKSVDANEILDMLIDGYLDGTLEEVAREIHSEFNSTQSE